MDWLYILKAVILGIVEGLTEFLPISSTGHLILAAKFLQFPEDSFYRMYIIVVQLFAILAVLIIFWSRLWRQVAGLFKGKRESWRFIFAWFLACIPASILGLLINDFIDEKLMSSLTVALALLVGAILILIVERKYANRYKVDRMEDMSIKQAVGVGVFQCLSLWPGFSRSASTIMGGQICGLSTRAAADFSFFLAIPIMFAASSYSLFKYIKHDYLVNAVSINREQFLALVFGCLAALAVALAVVSAFMKFLKKHSLTIFAYYRIALAGILLIVIFIERFSPRA